MRLRPGASHLLPRQWEYQMKATWMSLIGIRILAGCAPAFNVRSDYNGTTDSSRYRTVFISSGHSTGNPVMDQLIAEDAGIALRRRGCQLRSDSQADAIVVENTATPEQHTYQAFYDN